MTVPRLFLLLCLGLAMMACDGAPAPAQAAPPLPSPYKVITTCGMVTDIVRAVVGEFGKVEGLMGEGVDPHLYKPTTGDVAKILDADFVFYSGLMLEGRMGDTFVKAARRGKRVYAVTELIDESLLLEPEGFEGHWDPHVWGDVALWSRCALAVAEALSREDPSRADAYQANARALAARLAQLDDYARSAIASIPPPHRVLITAHDAFNYFGRAYGLEVIGIQGLSTESEAGLADIRKLIDLLVERKIPAVFVESSVSDKNVLALIEGARARGHEVKIGGTLFSDALGAPGTYEGTYIGMIDHNVTTIARALGGAVPPGGMQSRLSLAENPR